MLQLEFQSSRLVRISFAMTKIENNERNGDQLFAFSLNDPFADFLLTLPHSF